MSARDPGRPERSRLEELAADYEITRELGRGGTAVVYHARERDLGREVAIKVVHQTHVDDAEAVARLAREARVVAGLRHPNIVTLYGTRHLGDGSLALIMQYVPGRTLKAAIRESGPLPITLVETVLREVALALHYAHQRHGLIHRDIKPENIYLDAEGGRTLLSDFGIARPAQAESSLTIAGTALGTPAYMSPEQIDGLPLDGRSDLYSLGLVAYEMLTARQPWAGNNLYTIIYKQKHEELPPIREQRREVPPYLLRAIEGLLRKDREQRWSDAARFVTALRPTAANIAPPAITHWPTPRPFDPTPVSEDTPTIAYRRDADEQLATPVGQPPPPPPADPVDDATDESTPDATPVLRFFFDAEAVDDTPTAAPVRGKKKSGSRRVPLLIGLALFLSLLGAIAPMIGADEDAVDSPTPALQTPAAQGPPSDQEPAGLPARLVVLTDNQIGHAGAALAVPAGVLVEDAAGRPVSGVEVELDVVSGGGSVDPETAVTDSLGLAMTRWTLGESPGPNELAALISGQPDTRVLLRATALAGRPARLVALEGIDQSSPRGSALPEPLVVKVVDEHGNAVYGARVEFAVRAGGGSVEPAFAITDTAGVARAVWTLGSVQEGNTVRATLAQSDLHVEFNASASFRLTPQPRLITGGTHTCMLTARGDVSCWGANDNGQLGAGAAERVPGAAAVRGVPALARVAAGVAHTCALDRDGAAWCWGRNDAGQLGSGDRDDRALPVRVRAEETFTAITAGRSHTCALTEDGRAFCWGDRTRSTPAAIAGDHSFATLTAGWQHTCGLTRDGVAWCWGSNADGRLGNGDADDSATPVRVDAGVRFASIAAGAAHTCALTPDGDAYCWGQNGSGQLGTGTTAGSPLPARVASDVALAGLASGAVHTCGLTRAGEALCWGGNSFGQLGNESAADAPAPVPVSGDLRFAVLSAGGSHTCGRTASGEQYCWGYNVEGQLGDGTRADRPRPVRIRVAAR